MEFSNYFPIWNKLTSRQQESIKSNLAYRSVEKGTILHNGSMDCTGLFLIRAGQLRAYILSDEGSKVVTMVVPTDEEMAIARETVRLVK